MKTNSDGGDADDDDNYNNNKWILKLLTTLLASQENLHRTHLSHHCEPKWSQRWKQKKKERDPNLCITLPKWVSKR